MGGVTGEPCDSPATDTDIVKSLVPGAHPARFVRSDIVDEHSANQRAVNCIRPPVCNILAVNVQSDGIAFQSVHCGLKRHGVNVLCVDCGTVSEIRSLIPNRPITANANLSVRRLGGNENIRVWSEFPLRRY